ncbi:MAG: hypothetical protein M3R61_16535, partial [Chloroflexota bacterium]|nr:hypothetical protein [Chloroflexota bacterium]
LSAWMIATNRQILGIVPLLLATLLKYLTGPIVLLFIVARVCPRASVMGQRWLRMALYAGMTLLVTLLAWLPYWAGPRTLLSLFSEASRGLSGPIPTAILRVGWTLRMPSTLLNAIGLDVALLALAAVAIWFLMRLARIWHIGSANSFHQQIQDWALVLSFILIAMPRSHPWLLLTPMATLAIVYRQSGRWTLLIYALAVLWFVYRVGYW